MPRFSNTQKETSAASGVSSEDPFDIPYGGIDIEGELDPESRIPMGKFIFD